MVVTSGLIDPLEPEVIPKILSGFIGFLHRSRAALYKELESATVLSQELKAKVLEAFSAYLELCTA